MMSVLGKSAAGSLTGYRKYYEPRKRSMAGQSSRSVPGGVMSQVEVAMAVSDEGFEPQFDVAAELLARSQPDAAWSDRPRVLVEVEDSTRLQEILRRAGEAFGFNPVLGDPMDGGFSYICKFYTGDE